MDYPSIDESVQLGEVLFRLGISGNVEFGTVKTNSKVFWYPSCEISNIPSDPVYCRIDAKLNSEYGYYCVGDKDKNIGICTNIDTKVCVEDLESKLILCDISVNDLKPLELFTFFNYVCFNDWIGIVKEVRYMLELSAPDGETLLLSIVSTNNSVKIESISVPERLPIKNLTCELLFGLIGNVKLKSNNCEYVEPKWVDLCDMSIKNFEICHVSVDWLHNASMLKKPPKRPAKDWFDVKQLEFLKKYDPTVSIGEVYYYEIKGDERMLVNDVWQSEQRERFGIPQEDMRDKLNINVIKKFEKGIKILVRVFSRWTTANFIQQDGKVLERIPSIGFGKADYNVLFKEFFPGNFVVVKHDHPTIYGMIHSIDTQSRVANLRRFHICAFNSNIRPIFIDAKAVSLYDLKFHTAFDFLPGKIVKRTSFIDDDNNTCTIGTILGNLPNDLIQVEWVNGRVTLCWPQELVAYDPEYDLDEDYVEEYEEQMYDEEEDDYYYEMDMSGTYDDDIPADQDNSVNSQDDSVNPQQDSVNPQQDSVNPQQDSVNPQKDSINPQEDSVNPQDESLYKPNIPFHIISAQIPYSSPEINNLMIKFEHSKLSYDQISTEVRNFLEQVFEVNLRCTNGCLENIESWNKVSEAGDRNMNFNDVRCSPSNILRASTSEEDVSLDISLQPSEESGYFEITEKNPTSLRHRFSLKSSLPLSAASILAREYKILQDNLPAGIWIKGYSTRMDLFSVMIRGAANTPYEDGIFFFDVHLPSNYPYFPPEFHYISYSKETLNPNLYPEGKVCVSLLGTWPGKGNENWNSKLSSLQQVVTSIQALILNDEPYFNEPEFDRKRGTAEGLENSIQYNEKVVIYMFEGMIQLMKKTPEIFKKEIYKHFQSRGLKMIARLQSWSTISDEFTDEKKKNNSLQFSDFVKERNYDVPKFPFLPVSKGFCLSLNNVVNTFKTTMKKYLENEILPDQSKNPAVLPTNSPAPTEKMEAADFQPAPISQSGEMLLI